MATSKEAVGNSKTSDYSAKNIKNLQYPANVIALPGMYIGSVDEYGLFQILKEVGDNVVDEALEGRATRADIYLDSNTYTVCDDGNGIPIGLVKITEAIGNTVITMPAIQAACSIPHTSGKFDNASYKVSRGVHGLGQKLTNALSTSFIVTTFNENKWSTIEFSNGVLTKPLVKCSAPLNPVTNKIMTKGTKVVYTPNKKIFTVAKIPPAFIMSWAEIAAYFTPKLRVTLASTKSRKEYYFANGTLDYIDARLLKLKATSFGKPFSYNTPLCDVVLSFTDCPESDLRGFTNGSPNPNGGEHLNSTIKSLFAALTPYIKNKKQIFTVSDIKDGLIGLVNAKLSGPEFSSQTKERLTDARVKGPLSDDLLKAFTLFFSKNKDQALQLIERASKLNELKNSFNKSKKLVNALGVLKRKGLPADKYAGVNKGIKVADRELYLVEGLSAAGTVKAARFPYQSALALKGKIQNAAKAKEKTLESEEITYILSAIGFDPKVPDPYEKLQVGKVILMSDPDPDGPMGATTKILTLDGTSPTIGSLAKKWTDASKPFEVFSRNSKGELVIGMASNPRKVCLSDETYTLHFDNGTKVECTAKHKWVPSKIHSKQTFINKIPFVETRDLKVGDGINSVYTKLTTADACTLKNANRPYLSILNEKSLPETTMPVHKFVQLFNDPKTYAKYKALNVGVKGGAVHIHHKDDNSLNNTSSNLQYLSKAKHWGKHGKEMTVEYNGSPKHKQDLANFFNSKAGKVCRKKASVAITAYNVSDAHKETVAKMNGNPAIMQLQALGRCARLYKALIDKNSFTIDLFNYHAKRRNVSSWEDSVTNFSFETIKFKSLKAKPLVLPKRYAKASYPTQKISKFSSLCSTTIEKHGILNEANYNATRSILGSRGSPKWESGLLWLGVTTAKEVIKALGLLTNHTITKIVINKRNQKPMYCLTVEKYGNFMVDDGLGNGICSSNCHINTLLLTLFYKYLPKLFEMGMVYIAAAPEFYAQHKSEVYFGSNLSEVQAKIKDAKAPANLAVHHIKGYGEISAQLLRMLAMDPKTRTMIKINPISLEDHDFDKLMNDDVQYRKELLGIAE